MKHRTYCQHCGLARALDRLGERWTLLIVRDLLLGPRRYSQLLDSLQGIATNLLATRLKDMEEVGILEKQGRGPSTRYRLTESGMALEPAIMALARWGGQFMGELGPLDRKDLGWALISLKRRYQGGERLRVGIDIPSRHFELIFEEDRLLVQEREALEPQLRLTGTSDQLFGVLMQSHWSPTLEVDGDDKALDSFCRALALKR